MAIVFNRDEGRLILRYFNNAVQFEGNIHMEPAICWGCDHGRLSKGMYKSSRLWPTSM
jgi:hypothetical protein